MLQATSHLGLLEEAWFTSVPSTTSTACNSGWTSPGPKLEF